MNNDNLFQIEKELEEYGEKYLENIKEEIKKIFQEAIYEAVYERYEPITYERNFILRDAIGIEIKDNCLYIYNDINEAFYTSAVDGRNVNALVPWLIEMGHKDDTGINNVYHNYAGRRYLEVAKEMIMAKYPELKIEIIKDRPINI